MKERHLGVKFYLNFSGANTTQSVSVTCPVMATVKRLTKSVKDENKSPPFGFLTLVFHPSYPVYSNLCSSRFASALCLSSKPCKVYLPAW